VTWDCDISVYVVLNGTSQPKFKVISTFKFTCHLQVLSVVQLLPFLLSSAPHTNVTMYFVSHGLAAVRYVGIREPAWCGAAKLPRHVHVASKFYPSLYFLYLNPLYLLTGNTCVRHRFKLQGPSLARESNKPPYRWDLGVPKEVLGRHACISWIRT
jgi:hypothetical protein